MLKIAILAIGKIKNKSIFDLSSDYLKRLNPYVRLEIIELASESFSKNTKSLAKQKEGERIISFLAKRVNARVFLLAENGIQFNSCEFADFLNKINEEIIFVIGGSLGFSEKVLDKYKNRISLSKMTFPHELARVILLEQIYRAITIINNKEYHY